MKSKGKTKKFITTIRASIDVDLVELVKKTAREEFSQQRRCEYNRVDDYIKTICELQRVTKLLKSKLDRLESQVNIK